MSTEQLSESRPKATKAEESFDAPLILKAIEDVIFGRSPISEPLGLLSEHGEDVTYYRFSDCVVFSYYCDTNTLRIYVYGDDASATIRGAKMGDSDERIVELYGEPYERDECYGTMRYKLGDDYWSFEFFYDDSEDVLKVSLTGWFISNEPRQDGRGF